MSVRMIVAVLATLGVMACQPTPPTQAVVPATPVVSSNSFVGLINAERTTSGLGLLVENAQLSTAAQAHAADMVAQGYFSHTGQNGSTFSQRAQATGYACAAAENIAAGQQSEANVMAGWMNSAGHRRNILLRDATQFGLGRAGNTWVLMLGRGC